MHQALASWFEENRRALPWRESYAPYDVWVSEVMLQQTQVETALPYYRRFLAAFPNLQSLAAADDTQVLSLWSGLGYYSRARNLMAAARAVMRDHAGTIPEDYEALRELPGIGRYMAGAILSIAFNKPYAAVDGNVRRVLSRVHGWMDDDPKRLWEAAERLVRQVEPRIINQAIMELGATVCTFRAPRCESCPLQAICLAFKTGQQGEIPQVKRRPQTIRLNLFAVVERCGEKCRMRQADGMWEFPVFTELPAGTLQEVGRCRHTITHHQLHVTVYAGSLRDGAGFEWKDFDSLPVSSLTKKIWGQATQFPNSQDEFGN